MPLVYTVQVNDQSAKAFAGTKKRINDIENSVNRGTVAIEKMQKAFSAVAGLKVLESFIDGYEKQERAQRRLQQSAINVGDAFSYNEKKALSLTTALQKKTNYGDEDQLDVLSRLTTQLGSVDKAYEALPHVLDLAAYSQIDLTTAAEQYGKAAQGNITSLGKQFVALKEMKSAGKDNVDILNELNKITAKQAKIDVDPLIKFKNTIGEIGEDIGKSFLPSLNGVNKIFEAMPGPVQTLTVAIPALAASFSLLGGPLTLTVAALGAAGYLVDKISSNVKNSAMETEKYAESVKTLQEAMAGRAHILEVLPSTEKEQKRLMEQQQRTKKYSEQAGTSISPFDTQVQDVGTKVGQMRKALEAYDAKIKELSPAGSVKVGDYTKPKEDDFLSKQESSISQLLDFDKQTKEIIDSQNQSIQDSLKYNLDIQDEYNKAKFEHTASALDIEKQQYISSFNDKYQLLIDSGEYEQELTKWKNDGLAEIEKKYTDGVNAMYKQTMASRLNAIANMIGSFAQLNQVLKGNAKASQLLYASEAVMNTAIGITAHFKDPFPLNVMQVAEITASGIAQLATIKAQKFADGGWAGSWMAGNGNSRSDNIPTLTSPGERVLSVKEVQRMGGKDAVDRAIRSGKNTNSITLVVQGNVIGNKQWIRDELIPSIQMELSR